MLNMLPLVGPFSQLAPKLAPGHHFAHFYSSTDTLFGSVAEYLAGGIANREAVLVFSRTQTRGGIRQQLALRGMELDQLQASGQLLWLDADAVLAQLLHEKNISDAAFAEIVEQKIQRMLGRFGAVRTYGEMVDLLWQDGNYKGVLSLERLWDKLVRQYRLSVFCGYQLQEDGGQHASFNGMCCSHSHLLTRDGNLRSVGAV